MRFWTIARQTLLLTTAQLFARVDFDFNQKVYRIKHQMETILGKAITKKEQFSFVEFLNSEDYLKQPLATQIQFMKEVFDLESRRTLMIHLLHQKAPSDAQPLKFDSTQFQNEYNNLMRDEKFLKYFQGSHFGIPNAYLDLDKM
jgi:hypothetical protein